ncbi:bifunctional peptidase and (3S)-lysyl hydroxylase Jmjd7-like [Sycon ciliatum]|uniref:bifunctional peptidase and (3S)-lysyl hydroxylase Jmjd7-like n=1 Tax=Sycon ciliatum TaxID=27933 RepID=UPI0031F5FFC8
MDVKVQKNLLCLSREAAEFGPFDAILELEGEPDALWFYREHVSRGVPCIWRGAVAHWPAVSKWSNDYLRETVGSKEVSVAITPNGYADAVREDLNRFVMPHDQLMPVSQLLDVIERKEDFPGICYLQRQNSNFMEDFAELWKDTDLDIAWASKAFGAQPDAVNLWIGDERAVTSMHKDHYENLYCVVRGEKHFILLPPTDRPLIPHMKYASARYQLDLASREFSVVDEKDHGVIPWIPLDPQKPDLNRWPQYRHAHPLRCTLKAGDMLFLPSMWYHHVSQSQGAIAVNYWYDMAFDMRYAYFQCMDAITDTVAEGNCCAVGDHDIEDEQELSTGKT